MRTFPLIPAYQTLHLAHPKSPHTFILTHDLRFFFKVCRFLRIPSNIVWFWHNMVQKNPYLKHLVTTCPKMFPKIPNYLVTSVSSLFLVSRLIGHGWSRLLLTQDFSRLLITSQADHSVGHRTSPAASPSFSKVDAILNDRWINH